MPSPHHSDQSFAGLNLNPERLLEAVCQMAARNNFHIGEINANVSAVNDVNRDARFEFRHGVMPYRGTVHIEWGPPGDDQVEEFVVSFGPDLGWESQTTIERGSPLAERRQQEIDALYAQLSAHAEELSGCDLDIDTHDDEAFSEIEIRNQEGRSQEICPFTLFRVLDEVTAQVYSSEESI